MGALAATLGGGGVTAGQGSLRVGRYVEPCVLPDNIHRFPTVRHGKRRLSRNCGCRLRRYRRHLVIHGGAIHPKPCHRAERRQRVSVASELRDGGIQSGGPRVASVAALYAGTHHSDGANGCVQSPPFTRSATLPLAFVESRSAELQ